MEILKPYRARIDALDDRIVDLLAERMDIIREVAVLKGAHGIPAILPDRVVQVRERAAARGAEKGIDPELLRRIYTLLIDHSCALEDELMQGKAAKARRQAAGS